MTDFFQRMFSRPVWMEQANCRGMGGAVFFSTEDGVYRRGIANVKAVCAACDVRNECLQYALDGHERFGIWGGATPKERAAMRDWRVA